MLRITRIVVLLGVAVQIAAFLRTAMIAATLGASSDVDAYNLGLVAPSFASAVIGSWLQLSFVGRYASLVATGEATLAAAYRGRMLGLMLVLASVFSALCFFLPQQIMALFLSPGQTATILSAAAALKLSGLISLPIIVGDFFALVLNSHGRFLAAALAPLANALISVLGLALWPTIDLAALVWTLLLGCMAQFAVVLAALLAMGLSFRLRTASNGEIRTTLMLALPLLPAMMMSNSAAAIIQFRAAELGQGMVAIYGYTSRLHGAVAQILIAGLSAVLLPHIAALWSRGEKTEITVLFMRLARCTILIVACLTLGICLMGDTTTRILFERGAFNVQNAQQVSWLWLLLSLSLFPHAFGTFISKFCQAVRDAGSVLVSAVIFLAATWGVAWLGGMVGSLSIVTSSVAASVIATCIFWLFWLGKHIQVMPILRDIAIALFRTGLLLVPAFAVERWASSYTDGISEPLGLLLRGSLYFLTVLSLLFMTRSHSWFFERRPIERVL